MGKYWVALSVWFQWAKKNETRKRWWHLPGRDKPEPNDKVIIYQPSQTEESTDAGIEIKPKHKCKFIGDFTVDYIKPNSEDVKIKENKIIWKESEFVDIYSIKEDLEFLSKCQKNIGWCFRYRTWIPITKDDYDLIMSEKTKKTIM